MNFKERLELPANCSYIPTETTDSAPDLSLGQGTSFWAIQPFICQMSFNVCLTYYVDFAQCHFETSQMMAHLYLRFSLIDIDLAGYIYNMGKEMLHQHFFRDEELNFIFKKTKHSRLN